MTADSPPKAHEPRVFVSYVREDQDVVGRLTKELSAYGIKVWLDKTEIKPGYRWKDAIREAISEGDFFIACFSEAYQRRSKSYMNEELTLAIEELRQRPTDRAWFIPVLLSECEVPARGIGAGETLRDIQWVELHRNWEEGVTRVAATIAPDAQIAQPPRVWQLNDKEWEYLIAKLSSNHCVPILGRGINYGVAPADELLARKWAREIGKPEWGGLPFSEVAEHLAQYMGHFSLIEAIEREYAGNRFPDFNAPGEPHAVLSRLPCKVFITGCIDSFMEDALTSQGKKPKAALVDLRDLRSRRYSWRDEGQYISSISEPLVVHVFGRLDVPDSLVVRVRDLTRLLRDCEEAIPYDARKHIASSAHLWLGFDTGTIEQRTLYSLIEEGFPRHYQRFFDEEFEREASFGGRQRILLLEFMAELQSQWELKSRQYGGS